MLTDVEELEKRKPVESFKAQKIIDAHYRACLYAGIKISGTGKGIFEQFMFVIGASDGIRVCDDLMVARYLLERIASDFGVLVIYDEKIMDQ